jgi:hypothetical protein
MGLAATLAIGLASSCSGGDKDETAPEYATLAGAYAHLEPFCEKKAGCEVGTQRECLEFQRTPAQVEGAVDDLGWNDRQAERCRQAIVTTDECLLALGCADVQLMSYAVESEGTFYCFDAEGVERACPGEIPCESANENYREACGELDQRLSETHPVVADTSCECECECASGPQTVSLSGDSPCVCSYACRLVQSGESLGGTCMQVDSR